ncbi:pyridine nucleotide-disulfide oxidoreductase [Streptomyces scabiei]|uniref:NAD(P)/FAD-dependent oxidoreductase n=1 Tax=Streptomyces scabiei TaxID=1930 RepID=UPI0004E68738|nr:FAD-dependent oxidoreductase [Streptomyces scabiei]KFF98895.1 pyridine nucleotide-disulfide oxidoreductase [Streptomyces scabiei]
MDRVVVVGAGQAGVQVADSLRAGGFEGAVTLLGEETALPYQRPPLSKDYLAPDGDPAPLPLRSAAFFDRNGIDFRPGMRVAAIDRTSRAVALDDGRTLPYTALVLATGAAARTLAVPGHNLAGVHRLRTLEDAEQLRAELSEARSAVVVGAGFIGLEFAAAARRQGVTVTVLEAAERPLGRALSGTMARHLARAHRGMGTELRLGERLAGLVGRHGRVVSAVGTSGAEYPADLVLVGVGVRPRDELATRARLAVDDGILVDARLRTSDPVVHAIGDCAAFPTASGARVRLESVQNATDQARHVAETILGGTADYAPVPWFWSHQGTLRLQIAGLRQPGDTTVVSGDVRAGRFSVHCFRHGELVAVESLNRPADHTAARRLLPTKLLPTPEQVAQPGFSLKDHAGQLATTR